MARIRTIKPEFFTSEDIVGLSPLARLLYVALWCEADREGRLIWKPKTFKLRYLPADSCDVEALCEELLECGLVVLYGDGLAFIPKFRDHQHVNPREAASTLPEQNASERVTHASRRVADAQVGREGKGRERKESNSATPAQPAPAGERESPPLLTLVLNDGSDFAISVGQAEQFDALYPAVDVQQELRAMKAWLIANPKNRKTRSGVLRFVNSWLARSQNRATPAARNGTAGPQPMRELIA